MIAKVLDLRDRAGLTEYLSSLWSGLMDCDGEDPGFFGLSTRTTLLLDGLR